MHKLIRHIINYLFVVILVNIIACSNQLHKTGNSDTPVIFPAPPDTTRIQFLTRFSNSVDITGTKSSFLRYIFGEEQAKPIHKPYGITVHKGKIYICDTMLPGLEIIDLENKTFDYFMPSGLGQIKKPLNCALDGENRLYIADALRRQVVIFDKNGSYLSAIGDGITGKPTDVLIDQDKIYVCDLDSHQIRVYNKDTLKLLYAFPKVEKNQPYYLFSPTNLDVHDGKIYVTDTGDARVKVFKISGEYVHSIGNFGKKAGQFVRPKGLALDRQGRLYVADAAFENVQIFDEQSRVLMYFGGKYDNPGDMWLPAGITINYDSAQFFKEYLYPGFKLKYLIFVANQYGPDKISVYAFVE